MSSPKVAIKQYQKSSASQVTQLLFVDNCEQQFPIAFVYINRLFLYDANKIL